MNRDLTLEYIKRGVLLFLGVGLILYCLYSLYAGQIFYFGKVRGSRGLVLLAENGAHFWFTFIAYFFVGVILIITGKRDL